MEFVDLFPHYKLVITAFAIFFVSSGECFAIFLT